MQTIAKMARYLGEARIWFGQLVQFDIFKITFRWNLILVKRPIELLEYQRNITFIVPTVERK